MSEAEQKAREVAEAIVDRDYWRALGEKLGWQLLGWTYRDAATFLRGNERLEFTSAHAELMAQLRRDTIEECARVADTLAEQADRDHGKPSRTWGSGVMSGRCSAYRDGAAAIRKLAEES